MNRSRNSNLIYEYILFCRQQQIIISNAILDMRHMNNRLANFLSVEFNSSYVNQLNEVTRNLRSFMPETVPPPSHAPPPDDPPPSATNTATNTATNSTSSSAVRPTSNIQPPPPPPPPPAPTTNQLIRPNIPPPPPPPQPPALEFVNNSTNRIALPDPPSLSRLFSTSTSSRISNSRINRRNRREDTILRNRRRRRANSESAAEEEPLLPLSTRRLRHPVVHSPTNTRDSRLSPLNENRPLPASRRTRSRTFRRTPIGDRIFTFSNATNTIFPDNPFDDLSPVRIRPSVTQIRRGTELLTWNDISNNYQTACPIDMQDFSGNDSILRIRECGHIFREMNLRRHFRNSPRCPLCRFDIRDYIAPANNYSNITEDSASAADNSSTGDTNNIFSSNLLSQNLINSIDNDIMDIVEAAVNSMSSSDASGNILTADIRYEIR